MKKILRHFVIYSISLYLTSQVAKGMEFSKGIDSLLITGAVLALSSLLVKPLINILILPINLVSFGLFRWVASSITLYIVTLLVTDFKISGFLFNGFDSYWFSVPSIYLPGILAFIAFSFVISFIASFVFWLIK
ncbi:phage holin family protein [Patescibacteria group bacterium]